MELSGQKSNRWREYCNPLRGLSVPRVASLLEAGERGEFADLQWLYHYMERSDPMIFSILQRRRSALLESDWDIRIVATATPRRSQESGDRRQNFNAEAQGRGGEDTGYWKLETGGREGQRSTHNAQLTTLNGKWDPVLAEEQAAFLREAYDGVENFREAVGFLASGVFRGYAHLEKHWGNDGLVERLEPVEQWFWVRDGMFGEWEYNRDAISGRRRGEPIELDDFVIFESPALNRMLAVLYLRRNLSQRDWDSYLDVYGIPSIFMVGPPNMPEAKEAEYQEIAKSMISDGRGYLPNGSDVKYVNGGGGKLPFLEHLEYLDRQITIVGTGGLLTMLAEPGSGTLAGGAHTEAFRQIARGDAAVLSEAFQRDFDTPLLAQAFGDRTPLAYFQFSPPTEGNPSKVVDDAVKLAGAGYPVRLEEVSEKTGYQIET
jgi:phage gp29-like protein